MKTLKFLCIILMIFSLELFGQSNNFDEISYAEIAYDYEGYNSDVLYATNNKFNQLIDGTILVYVTNTGHYGKLQVLHYGKDLTIKYITYQNMFTILSSSDSLVIPAGYSLDLDTGKFLTLTDDDVFWDYIQGISDTLYWRPMNHAQFSIYDPAFNNITFDDIIFDDQFNYTDAWGGFGQQSMIQKGEVYIYETDQHRKGKFCIVGNYPNTIIKWVTYGDDGTIFSQGSNLHMLEGWYIDLDYGLILTQENDFLIEANSHGAIKRVKAPYFMPYDPEYNRITEEMIEDYGYEKGRIDCPLNQYNEMPEGTIIVYKTSGGSLGKLKILEFGASIRFKWFTYYHRSGITLFYFGHNYWVSPGDTFTLDPFSPMADIEFSEGPDYRYWYTMPNTEYFVYDPDFRQHRWDEIAGAPFTITTLNGSPGPDNELEKGTLLFYKTSRGNYGKMKILKYGYNLKVKWLTFTPNYQLVSNGSDLVIKGTYTIDLDEGVESSGSDADIFWSITNKEVRHLYARNGAAFAKPEVLISEATENLSQNFELYQNYPNPFNPTTTIGYRLPRSGDVILTIYNTLGQKVKTLVHEFQLPGAYKVIWDGRNESGKEMPSGIYIYRLKQGEFEQSRKMILLQ